MTGVQTCAFRSNELEERLKVQLNINSDLLVEVYTMQKRADNSFLNSALHKQLLRENRALKATAESKDIVIRVLEEKSNKAVAEIEETLELKMENSRLNAELGRQICEKSELRQEIDSLNKKIELDNAFYNDNDTMKKKLDETLILSAQKTSKILKLEKEIEDIKEDNKSFKRKIK